MEYIEEKEIQEIRESTKRIEETLKEEYGFKLDEFMGIPQPHIYTTEKGEETPNHCTVMLTDTEIEIWLDDEEGTIINNAWERHLIIGDTVIPKDAIIMLMFSKNYLL